MRFEFALGFLPDFSGEREVGISFVSMLCLPVLDRQPHGAFEPFLWISHARLEALPQGLFHRWAGGTSC